MNVCRLTCLVIAMLGSIAAAEQPATRPAVASEWLKQPVTLQLEGRSIQDVFTAIQQHTRLNVQISWFEMELMGVDRDTKLVGKLENVPLGLAFDHIINSAGIYPPGGRPTLEYNDVDGNIIKIVTKPRGEVRVYNVAKLVGKLHKERQQVETNPEVRLTVQDTVDDLIRTITTNVDPEVWRDAGGTVGSINLIGLRLVIEQSPANHTAIAKLLEKLDQADGK